MSSMGDIDVATGVNTNRVVGWSGSHGRADSPADLLRGLSTSNGGIPRMVQPFGDKGIDMAWYIPGHTTETFRDKVETVAADGHEIGVHGYSHENPTDLSREQEDATIEGPIELIEDVTGNLSMGYRASWWKFNENTPELVGKHDLLYGGSLMEREFEPGYMRKGDSQTKIQYEQSAEMWMSPYEYGTETDVVETPISWYYDDIPPMLFIKQPLCHSGYKDPNMMCKQYYKKRFGYLYNRRGMGVYTLTIHPGLHSLPRMIPFFEDFIQYVKSHENAEFETPETVVRRYKDDPSVYENESGYV